MSVEKYDGTAWVSGEVSVLKDGTDTVTLYPATLRTAAAGETEYKVHGKTEVIDNTLTGVGEKTDNLFDKTATDPNNGYENKRILRIDGSLYYIQGYYVSEYIAVDYTISYYAEWKDSSIRTASICFYDENKTFISGMEYNNRTGAEITVPATAAYARLTVHKDDEDLTGLYRNYSTAPTTFIPHGYSIPTTINGTTSPIYIGNTQLMKDEYLDSETGKIYKMVGGTLIPTDPPVPFPQLSLATGDNTLNVSTTVLPSAVDVIFEGWHDGEVDIYDGTEWDEPNAPSLSMAPRAIPQSEPETDVMSDE